MRNSVRQIRLAAGILLVAGVAFGVWQIYIPTALRGAPAVRPEVRESRPSRGPSLGVEAAQEQLTFTGRVGFPALSPDGLTVAFASGESLILQDVKTGESTTIPELKLRSMFGMSPRWSPDGASILYSDSGGLALISRRGGVPQQIARFPAGAACWSPDGSRIAIASLFDHGITLFERSTGSTNPIPVSGFGTPGFAGRGQTTRSVHSLDWSRSSDLLLAVTHERFEESSSIWVFRSDGSRLRKVLETTGWTTARWSAEGDAIYYLSPAPADTFNLARLPVDAGTGDVKGTPVALLGGFRTYGDFSVSADRLVYRRLDVPFTKLWVAEPADLEKPGQLQARALTTGTAQIEGQAPSPDGRWVAYCRNSADSQVYKVPLGGGAATQLTSSDAKHSLPAWSPDGRFLAFISDEGGKARLWRIDADGGKPQPWPQTQAAVPGPSMWSRVVWSPGPSILYNRVVGGPTRYVVFDPRTEVERPLYEPDPWSIRGVPAYSPDGTRLAFIRYWGKQQSGL